MCGKEVDFDEPWCDHETMEESAWLDMQTRLGPKPFQPMPPASNEIERMAEEVGFQTARNIDEMLRKEFQE